MADALAAGLAELLHGDVQGLTRLAGGNSRENWSFDLVVDGVARPMLLRRDPLTSVANTERAVELAVLRGLQDAPIPTPVVVAADLDGGVLERPWMLLERAPGRADRSVLRERDPFRLGPNGQRALAVELCDLLAAIHQFDARRIDVESTPMAELASTPDHAEAEIQRWEAEIARVSTEPQPELTYVGMWLREHRPPPPPRTTLVHADFRPANVLVHQGKTEVVLDWEFAHLGDPIEDVGWYTAPIYRREHFVRGAWEVDDFLDRYAEHSGITVEPARLAFWQVLAIFKLAAIALAGVSSFLDDRGDRATGSPEAMLQATVAATIAAEAMA